MTLTGNSTLVDPGFDIPPENPLILLQHWLNNAVTVGVCEPYDMVLSTVDASSRPSSRVVLLEECDETGISFGTNQGSEKGKDLKLNPWAAGTLWWRETIQQINFRGQVTQFSKEKSGVLFQKIPRETQAVAALSKQSSPMMEKNSLKDKVLELIQTKGPIERPAEWYAYYLVLESIEFWHGSKDRFHKRLRYDLIDDEWRHQKLQP